MTEKISFSDPGADYSELEAELDQALGRVLRGGGYIRGEAVTGFERAFADYLGAGHAIGMASGTDALCLALTAAGVGPGDEVITAANTFIATAMAIVRAGARPVLVDVKNDSLNLDPARLEAARTERTKAVIPVHLYGQPADMDEIMQWADDRGVLVIEDACQSHGAKYKGRKTGTLGLAGAFSFYPTKNLGGMGDGGMVATESPELAGRVKMLGNYGSDKKDLHEFMGTNSRLDSIQAAILGVKLGRLDTWNLKRQEHAALYRALLEESDRVRLPAALPDRDHVYHQFVIRVSPEIRDRLRQALQDRGVPTMVHYPTLIHQQPAFAFLGHGPDEFPMAAAAVREIISLPVHQHLTESQIQHIALTVLQEIRGL